MKIIKGIDMHKLRVELDGGCARTSPSGMCLDFFTTVQASTKEDSIIMKVDIKLLKSNYRH